MPAYLKKSFLVLVTVLVASLSAVANGLSYIYIQGDKQTPFYVKLEGEMQPRYGKNYCIISKLAPGPIHIEILFQQNAYPAEKFTILVPANGYRGFMLVKKEGKFSLYDLQQAFYIPPGNSEADDVVPKIKQPVPVSEPEKQEPVATTKSNTAKPVVKNNNPKPVTNTPPPPKPQNDEPNFISNIELTNERTFDEDSAISTKPAQNQPVTVANSDCPRPMGRSDYEDLLRKARNKSDNNRLKFLLEQTGNCYSTIQLRALSRSLAKDQERYAFLKEVYPRVTDQANFSSLESTIISKEWKGYFRLILE